MDIAALAFLLLAISMLLTWSRERGAATAMAAVFSTAFALTMRVELVIMLPVFVAVLIAGSNGRMGQRWSAFRGTKRLLLVAVFVVIVLPELVFIYVDYTTTSFGQQPGHNIISLQILETNILPSTAFWLDEYQSVTDESMGGAQWHAEYPLVYTLLGVLGLALMVLRGRRAAAAVLMLWFAIVLVFYSAFFLGIVNWEDGIDISRFFMEAFPAVSMAAAFFTVGVCRAAPPQLSGRKIYRRMHPHPNSARYRAVVLLSILLLLFAGPVYQFITIVTLPPASTIPFGPLRSWLAFDAASAQDVPSNCVVLSYIPQFWWMLNRSSMYAGLALNRSIYEAANGVSGGCMYLNTDDKCYGASYLLNASQNQSYALNCDAYFSNFTTTVVATENYSGFGYNRTWVLYRILAPTARFNNSAVSNNS